MQTNYSAIIWRCHVLRWLSAHVSSGFSSRPCELVRLSESRQKPNQRVCKSLSLLRTTVRVQYLARCTASLRKAELSGVPAAELKRKAAITHGNGRINQALWTFPAAPASVLAPGAGRTSLRLWRRQVKCMQKRDLLKFAPVIHSASAVVALYPAVRAGTGTWSRSAVHRLADES